MYSSSPSTSLPGRHSFLRVRTLILRGYNSFRIRMLFPIRPILVLATYGLLFSYFNADYPFFALIVIQSEISFSMFCDFLEQA